MAQELAQIIFERKLGLTDYPRKTDLLISPDTTWKLTTWPVGARVQLVTGYKFEPDELGKLRITIAIDGEIMLYRIPLTEENLEFYWFLPKVTEAKEIIWVKNLDLKRSHRIDVTRFYKIIDKEPYSKIYEKAAI